MTPFLLTDLEKDAKRLADEISLMTGSLRSNLHAVRSYGDLASAHFDMHFLDYNHLHTVH